MGAIGEVEDAYSCCMVALARLSDAVYEAESERHLAAAGAAAGELQELYDELDDVCYRIGRQREALRP